MEAAAQSIERATSHEEVIGSILAPGAHFILAGSASV